MTRLPCLSLSSLRRSFPSVIPRQWSHLKPPARRQNDSLDSLLNEMLHFPILLNFPKIEALYFSFTAECNTRCFETNRLLSSGSNSHVAPSFLFLFYWSCNSLAFANAIREQSIYQNYLFWFVSLSIVLYKRYLEKLSAFIYGRLLRVLNIISVFEMRRFHRADNASCSCANGSCAQRKVQFTISMLRNPVASDPGGPAKHLRGLVMVSYQVGNYSVPRGSAVFLIPDSTNARSRATNKRRIIVNDDPRYCTPMMKGRVSGFQARVRVWRYGNGSRLLACLLDPMG